MLISGRCHCGNISFLLRWEPAPVAIPARACTCTFCRKHGGVWTSDPAGALTVTIRHPADVVTYAFGSRTADFHLCSRCGVVPVVTSRIDGHLFAVVSVNAFEGVDPSWIQPAAAATFDDETEARRRARRKLSWIASVEFTVAPS